MNLAVLQPEPTSRPQDIPAPPGSAPFLKKIPGVTLGRPAADRDGAARVRVLPLGFGGLDEALPDGGLPRGAVVELSSPYGLAKATSIALAACASAQQEARLRGGEGTAGAWCAWIEPSTRAEGEADIGDRTSLFAPAVEKAGVDLGRLLVVRPPLEALGRVAARVAQGRVFSVIVVDLAGVPGRRADTRLDRWPNAVRRLAMAVEGMETTVLLLTDALAPRALPLPVALRLEVERPAPDRLRLTVAKDRRGRVAPARAVALPHPGTAVAAGIR